MRTTVRNVTSEGTIREMLARAGVEPGDRLSVVAADLTSDDGWDRAMDGVRFVHHVASPFPAAVPEHEDDLIRPAREGTLRVLRAARTAGVERVVLTSSFAAIGYGAGEPPAVFDETCWSDPNGRIAPYAKSKTLAERAAWDFVADGGPELAVVNPVGIFGPVLGGRPSTSIELVRRILKGMPGCPRLWFGIVDVRDVADLHLRAMAHPEAAGERFLAVSGDFFTIQQMAMALKDHLGERGSRIRTRTIPDFVVRLVALFDPAVRLTVPELGREKHGTGAKAERMLGWSPRTPAEALAATADSLFELGLA
ncbi:MAG: NAD-dependent epimerase/dehydratase family protein [Myxococcota bacterium]